jgi:hypothetical protein
MICTHCQGPVSPLGFYCESQCMGEYDARSVWWTEFRNLAPEPPWGVEWESIRNYFQLSFALPCNNPTPQSALTDWLKLTTNPEQQA